ncbi:MAG TPA: endo-1,4-beta-xylanase [Anaerolineales bacterium]
MKYLNLFLLFAFLLTSCVPAATVAPTQTVIPTSTLTPVPSPTITPTPAPENLADASDLPTWIEQYVNAYGGKITVNGTEMDSNQLTNAIKSNPDSFTQAKRINGIKYSFLVVNGIPLAMRESAGMWQKTTLKMLADLQGLKIGSFFGGNNTTDQDFQNILKIQKQEFNLGAIYQGMDCCIENQKGVFTLDILRYLVKETKDSNMSLLLHPLVWSEEIPNWLRSTESKDVWNNSLKEYIQTVMSETKGTNPIVVVVNEYKNPQDIIYQKLGPDYLEMAFQEARATDPSATLIYNDYQNETISGSRYQLTMDVVKELKAKSLIDGIGLEMHLSGYTLPSKDDVVLAMKSYGLPVYLTEFDVNMGDVHGDAQTRMLKQAQIYEIVVDACIESGVCKYIVPFQIGDKFSVWENDPKFPGYSKNAAPTIYDDNLKPKPAYYAVTQSLYEHLP